MRAHYPVCHTMYMAHGKSNVLPSVPRHGVSGRHRLRHATLKAAHGNGGASLKVFSPSKVSSRTFCITRSVNAVLFTSAISHCMFVQINLFLRVMRRREDGYHDLASLFHVR
jgi:hypothetical protein